MTGASYRVLVGDAREKLRALPEASAHCLVTSPPYWSLRDYGVAGQLGLEDTPEEYVTALVEVFREAARVLRPDGTAWVNLGDCYSAGGRGGEQKGLTGTGVNESAAALESMGRSKWRAGGLPPKNLLGLPWRVAFALQADGWYLRQECIWHKTNPQPEAVEDRPTRDHEQVFLLTRREHYFYDTDAVRQAVTGNAHTRGRGLNRKARSADSGARQNASWSAAVTGLVESRNLRSVWTFPTQPNPEAHFAAFPEDLPRRCTLAGTSERGCCSACGVQVVRVVAKRRTVNGEPLTGPARNKDRAEPSYNPGRAGRGHALIVTYRETVEWRPGCSCGAPTVPCTVLDPFAGTSTTGVAALKLGRSYVGVELNPEYAAISRRRLARVAHGALAAARERPQAPDPGPLFARLIGGGAMSVPRNRHLVAPRAA
jgi:DNA modification methylase